MVEWGEKGRLTHLVMHRFPRRLVLHRSVHRSVSFLSSEPGGRRLLLQCRFSWYLLRWSVSFFLLSSRLHLSLRVGRRTARVGLTRIPSAQAQTSPPVASPSGWRRGFCLLSSFRMRACSRLSFRMVFAASLSLFWSSRFAGCALSASLCIASTAL